MSADRQPGGLYWSLVEPVWRSVSIYHGPDVFLEQFERLHPDVGRLLAAHWCQSEVRNGGLHQFFSNSTGVLAPEARAGFVVIGLDEWAAVLEEAMRFFGEPYPRDQADRQRSLAARRGRKREEWDPFYRLDDRFYAWLNAEDDRWARAADRFASSVRH